jgi:ABC-type transport system involved in cytochrome c biogenesis permease component
MNPPTPSTGGIDVSGMLVWIWIAVLSILGGSSSFQRKIESGHVRTWNLTEFIGELTTASLSAIITANLCDWMTFPQPLKYALVGIAAHMGSRALFKLESVLNAKFNLPTDTPAAGGDHAA